MSISRRIAALFRVKANKALDRAEDPREVLDYSYEQQLEIVQKVRRGVADVATSRERVELQITQRKSACPRKRTSCPCRALRNGAPGECLPGARP